MRGVKAGSSHVWVVFPYDLWQRLAKVGQWTWKCVCFFLVGCFFLFDRFASLLPRQVKWVCQVGTQINFRLYWLQRFGPVMDGKLYIIQMTDDSFLCQDFPGFETIISTFDQINLPTFMKTYDVFSCSWLGQLREPPWISFWRFLSRYGGVEAHRGYQVGSPGDLSRNHLICGWASIQINPTPTPQNSLPNSIHAKGMRKQCWKCWSALWMQVS